MKRIALLTSASGRIDLKTYNIVSLVPFGLLIGGAALTLWPTASWQGGLSVTIASPQGAQWGLFGLGLACVGFSLWTALALCAKRLHDRDKSAAWMALWILSAALVFAPGVTFTGAAGMTFELPVAIRYAALAIGLVGLGAALWHTFELSCMRGTPDKNRFGPAT